ncbi:YdhK family protein [Cytobacillus massiliigabonensis]|uniref:YdhK family protein n=1 Tax=Cytobacillus massiliigabonensis TaxID=1871011 RepID=UPI000C83A41C|nr:YdhK family protein [Cytobacillus massiliigabonensis]
MLIKKIKKPLLLSLLASIFLLLGACSNATEDIKENNNDEKNTIDSEENQGGSEEMEGMDHSNMEMSSSGAVPEGLKVAENPTYKVGSKAIINSDHMEGMKGAEATIAGAYDTTAYSISYDPTTGGERVKNHKWVIHEEIPDAGDQPLEPGSEFTIDASHMEGMDGAKAAIDTAEKTTVYMVDFKTASGTEVKNHKWVTESELSPVE